MSFFRKLRRKIKKKYQWVKEQFGMSNKIVSLQLEVIKLKKQLVESDNPRLALEKILKQDLSWYDYKELTPNGWIDYYEEAQNILRGRVLNNEINHAISLITLNGIKNNTTDDVQRLHDSRIMILALDNIRKHLEEIEPYSIPEKKEELDEVVPITT